MKPEDIITDSEIERVHENANFGNMRKRDVVDYGALKCACGYYQGPRSIRIIQEHGLVSEDYDITKKGKVYLWSVFGDDKKV